MIKLKTVNEVSKLTSVSIRTLHYYDSIGLLCPSAKTESGYRLYDDTDLAKLQSILLFRELEFPLKEIKTILSSNNFDMKMALIQQVELLSLKREHLDNLICFAREILTTGVNKMDFKAFDNKKFEDYKRQAKESYGDTAAYKEFEEKSKGRTAADEDTIGAGLMNIFKEFGEIKEQAPDGAKAQALAEKVQNYISDNYYKCTKEIFICLADMYDGGGEMTDNIDLASGNGTAAFAASAIRIYCQK